MADEVFLTGTAAEVTPVREIDHRAIGAGRRGPIAKALQDAFFAVGPGPRRQVRALAAGGLGASRSLSECGLSGASTGRLSREPDRRRKVG